MSVVNDVHIIYFILNNFINILSNTCSRRGCSGGCRHSRLCI